MYRRIRDLREDRDLLQRDLAAYLQCSQVCYSHYEMGKRDIPTDVLIKLADFYHTSTDYLLARTDENHLTQSPWTLVTNSLLFIVANATEFCYAACILLKKSSTILVDPPYPCKKRVSPQPQSRRGSRFIFPNHKKTPRPSTFAAVCEMFRIAAPAAHHIFPLMDPLPPLAEQLLGAEINHNHRPCRWFALAPLGHDPG